MSSKRKTNGCKTVQCVMSIVNKLGCELHEFFARAKYLKYVPDGFNVMKEVNLFKQLRDHGFVKDYPDWGIPTGILDFVDDLNEADCPRKLYGDLKHSRPPASTQASGASPKTSRPAIMTRPSPTYA